MGTQAVVSVVRDGKTVVKAVTGCNGGMAKALAELIAQEKMTGTREIHEAAQRVGFGCRDCNVTMGNGLVFAADVEGLEGGLYYSKFDDPTFNPRWDYGTASYVFLVDAKTWEVTNINGEDEEE